MNVGRDILSVMCATVQKLVQNENGENTVNENQQYMHTQKASVLSCSKFLSLFLPNTTEDVHEPIPEKEQRKL